MLQGEHGEYMSDKQDQIKKILGNFVNTTASIHAAAVMTRDGIPIASKLNEGINEERLSAISASLLSLANRAVKDLEQGDLEQVLIDSTKGFVLMLKVGESAVLSVISEQNSRLGMLLIEAKKSARVLAEIIA